jgi:predicted 3-demethylubiquinone-9 3-methyltransferase (glyoxalase superfamily)
MQKISPFLWFDGNAEEAANLYTSLFPNSKITNVSRYGEGGPGPAGTAMVVNFQLFGQDFFALNGGPMYKFTEAISFMVHCETQEEVDRYWSALTDGGEEVQCGWLKDKYGLAWQITPTVLGELLSDPDPEKSGRVMQAMMGMVKLDIAGLQKAYDGQ